MSVLVRCPGCKATLNTRRDQLGQRGQCAKCKLVFRLATPVGERLEEDEPDEPEIIEETEARPLKPLPLPDEGEEEEEEEERPRRRRKPPPPSQSPRVLLAVLIFLFFGMLAVGGFFLARHLATPNEPDVAEIPPPAQPKSPEQPPVTTKEKEKEQEKKKEPVEPPPVQPMRPAGPFNIPLDGQIYALYTGGAGRYLVFHLSAPRQLSVYDVQTGKFVSTIRNLDPNARVAVGHEKVFVGRWTDGRITRYDLRTGAQEATGGVSQERLEHLATCSGSDGPLVAETLTAEKRHQFRLFDSETLKSIEVRIDDPTKDHWHQFPFSPGIGTAHIAMSVSGRVFTLSDRLYSRTATGYKTAKINFSSALRPSPDGTVQLGNSLIGEDGRGLRFEDREIRWFLPAANGPFFLSIEYIRKPSRLLLHTDQETKPLGELPGSDELAAGLTNGPGGVVGLHRQLAFLPEPGLIVFAPTGAREARALPVDLPAILTEAGRDVIFTSVPGATVSKGRPYAYTATAITRDGARPTFALATGPAGMKITPDGQLSWTPDSAFDQAITDVRLIARLANGKQAVQQFQLFLPLK